MPRNFSWLIPDEIAGMARPDSAIYDYESLRDNGIDAIVSLTEGPLNTPLIEEFGFEYKHIPIEDLSVPTMEQIEDFVTFAHKMREQGKRIVVHCGAGIGRTGTMLACYLVSKGYSAGESVAEVRWKRPGSIETHEQVEVIHRYEKKLAIDSLYQQDTTKHATPEKGIITKPTANYSLKNYEETYRNFNWEQIKKSLDNFSSGRVNIAYNAIDQHANDLHKDKVALYWMGAHGQKREYTFHDMKTHSDKVGAVLKNLGVGKGDRVFVFLPRIPELYVSIIAIAKIGAVAGPMFSAFGPEAVRDRLQDSEAKVLITTPELKKRVDEIRNELPRLEHILIVGADGNLADGEVSYEFAVSGVKQGCEIEWVDTESPLYMLYTSGTTGKPKGVVHVHNDMISHYITTKWVLDLREDDIYWCTADPGWVTGTVYGIWGPWLNGESQVVYEGRFDAETWYSIIQDYKVTIWYTAPTALRMLMKAGDETINKYDLSSLRYICSVGEPLNPEVIRWGMKVYNLPIHDNWWQTETGSIMIANYPCLPIKVGSMGKPFPGIEAAIVDEDGNELPPEQHGLLALKPGWPSMMRAIWRDENRYGAYFKIPGWYTSGDTAYKDKDGYFWFIGRADDVIMTAGHRVGPFEVESALVEHEAVVEAGVIGKPDVQRNEIIKAFIVLREGYKPSYHLKMDIEEFIKRRLAAHAYPREIEFVPSVPKTRSGKIMRRLLKAKELGLPTGDLSTLEDD